MFKISTKDLITSLLCLAFALIIVTLTSCAPVTEVAPSGPSVQYCSDSDAILRERPDTGQKSIEELGNLGTISTGARVYLLLSRQHNDWINIETMISGKTVRGWIDIDRIIECNELLN